MQSLGANARQAEDDAPMTAAKAAIPEPALEGGTEKWNHYLLGHLLGLILERPLGHAIERSLVRKAVTQRRSRCLGGHLKGRYWHCCYWAATRSATAV